MGSCCETDRGKSAAPSPAKHAVKAENAVDSHKAKKVAESPQEKRRNSEQVQLRLSVGTPAVSQGKGRERRVSHVLDPEEVMRAEVVCSPFNIRHDAVSSAYHIGVRLYSDRISTVFVAEHRQSGQSRIIKKLRKPSKKLKKKEQTQGRNPDEEFRAEVEILSQIDHPNVIKVFEMFEDDDYFYLISENLTGGAILDYISLSKSISETTIAHIMSQVFSGISHCHARGIIHRNLQLENLLLQKAPTSDKVEVKITGFGAACLRTDQEKLNKRVGSALYVSPEALKRAYVEKSDIWSCGVIMYLLLSGNPPFFASSNDEIFRQIRSSAPQFPTGSWANITPEAQNLIRSMLIKNPAMRPSASDCLNHAWIKKYSACISLKSLTVSTALQELRKFRSRQYLKQTVLAFVSARVTAATEFGELVQAFRALDRNNDGMLSKEELLEAYSKLMTREQATIVVEGVIRSVDLDGNGVVDYSEFILAAKNHKSLLSTSNLRLAFQLFDQDSSGRISVKEFKSTLNIDNEAVSKDIWADLMRQVGCEGEEMDFKGFSQLMIIAVGR